MLRIPLHITELLMSRTRKEFLVHNEKIPYLKAKHPEQQDFIDDLLDDDFPICINDSCAGTGKTFLAVSAGIQGLKCGKYKRMVITRPMVETGKSMGFLPGTFEEKMDPFLQPMFDEMRHYITGEEIREYLNNGKNKEGRNELVICPLQHMRGRNFHDAYMLLDEAGSATREELMLFITRMGMNSKAVIIGDQSQSDLYTAEYYFNKRKFDKHFEEQQAFGWFLDRIEDCEGVSITEFSSECVVRNPIIGRVLRHMKLDRDGK